jgi:predicted ribosome quality control (RQC) complex YloA/Tae2 family protein
MSLSGAFLHIVKTEIIEKLPIGARIDKIHQPSRDEIVLSFREHRLLFSANAMSARVNLTPAKAADFSAGGADMPAVVHRPPMFCVVLRKHLGSGRLAGISQEGLERVLSFDFICTNEIGDTVNNRLVIEIMGRTSNIILVNSDTGKIIDAIKRVTDEISSVRRVLPGVVYTAPVRDLSRVCLLDSQFTVPCGNLLKQLEGVCPLFVREAEYCSNGVQAGVDEFLQKAHIALTQDKAEITLVSDLDGTPRDFCFMPITQYGTAMITARYESANLLLDSFFFEKSKAERVKQRSGNIMKTLMGKYERLSRKIANQRLELIDCRDRDKLKIYGDLVNTNIYRLSKGDEMLECEDYTTGEQVKIRLDTRLSPAANAQRYYGAYRKLDTAEKMLIKLIAEGEAELVYLDSVIDAASRAESDAELNAIRDELRFSVENRKKPANNKKQAKSKPLPPIKFSASDGTEILVGRNNKQNDELTFKIARPDDIWLHTKDIAGSHVILRCSEKSPAIETIIQAAVIAAQHSKGSQSSRVPVDYTFAKFVKKPSGSKPGFVIFTHNKTVYVTPRVDSNTKL